MSQIELSKAERYVILEGLSKLEYGFARDVAKKLKQARAALAALPDEMKEEA